LGVVEGEAEVDDGDVYMDAFDDGAGFAAVAGEVAGDTHGLKEDGEAIDPGVGVPADIGKEEVEAAGVGVGVGLGRGIAAAGEAVEGEVWMEADVPHRVGRWASCVPGGGGEVARVLTGV
jgi:hypothetical protein